MGCNPPYLLSYRLRLLLLFTLSLTVVGWATSNYFVGAIQVIPRAKNFMATFHKVMYLGNEETLGHEVAMKKAELANCPSVSPNLSKYLLDLFCLSTTKKYLADVEKSVESRIILN